MDGQTERLVMEAVINHLQDKTILAITHRIHSIKDFDRIIIFKDGCIVGEGSFDHLMKTNHYFKDLCQTAPSINGY